MKAPLFHVHYIPIYSDNYVWVLQCNNEFWLIDPGDHEPVIRFFEERQQLPKGILVTHNHWDHVTGIPPLCNTYPLEVLGPPDCGIPDLTGTLAEGDTLSLDGIEVKVFFTPGHKKEHLSYYLPQERALFCGDTLFSAGCGRIFDSKAEDFYQSLQRLSKLPDNTQVFCTHEYTLANIRFAQTVEPDNSELEEYRASCQQRLDQNQITLPTNIALEKAINPFLRCHIPQVQAQVQAHMEISSSQPSDIFEALRRWKDQF